MRGRSSLMRSLKSSATTALLACVASGAGSTLVSAWAQTVVPPSAATSTEVVVPAAVTAPSIAVRPITLAVTASAARIDTTEWDGLTPAQKHALAPLQAGWSSIDEAQKRKWLSLSRNFAGLSPSEQAKLHSRMHEWVALSPTQRVQARLNFAETKKVPVDNRLAKWEAYQALSPEEKRKLAATAVPRPPGAAPATKPVPPQKLVVPVARPKPNTSSNMGSERLFSPDQVDPKTLLPRRAASSTP